MKEKIIGINDEEDSNNIQDIQQKEIKKINAKKIIILISMSIILIALAIIGILYTSNKDIREVLDKYVLNLDTIEINENANNYIYAYDKYIAVLNNGKLTHYNNTGKEEATTNLEIATPLVDVNNRYLLIADKNSQKNLPNIRRKYNMGKRVRRRNIKNKCK